jgi:hypothetical protein
VSRLRRLLAGVPVLLIAAVVSGSIAIVQRKLGLGDDPGTNRRVLAAVMYLTRSANG